MKETNFNDILNRIEKKYGEEFYKGEILDFLDSGNKNNIYNEKLAEKLYLIHLKGKIGQKEKIREIYEIPKEKLKREEYRPIERITIKPYVRKERTIKPYVKGYKKWSSAEIKFLQVRKQQKITPAKIIFQYNEHFKEKRTSSSIKTKIFRI